MGVDSSANRANQNSPGTLVGHRRLGCFCREAARPGPALVLPLPFVYAMFRVDETTGACASPRSPTMKHSAAMDGETAVTPPPRGAPPSVSSFVWWANDVRTNKFSVTLFSGPEVFESHFVVGPARRPARAIFYSTWNSRGKINKHKYVASYKAVHGLID